MLSLDLFGLVADQDAESEIKDWKDNFVYGAETLPTIALLMMGPWKQTEPIYNTVEV